MHSVDEWIHEGNRLYENEQYEAAVRAFQSALDLDPQSSAAWEGRGRCRWHVGDRDTAHEDVERALDLDPENARAWTSMGAFLFTRQQYAAAETAFTQALRRPPEQPRARWGRGCARMEQGAIDAASRDFVQLDPVESREARIRSYVRQLIDHGREHVGQGRFEDALPCFAAATILAPGQPEGYFYLGNALDELERYDEAVDAFEDALRINPNSAEAHNNRGLALNELGRYDEAVDAFEDALRIYPDFAAAHNNRGLALRKLERYDEAVAAYDDALRIYPDYAVAHNNRGSALRGQGRLEGNPPRKRNFYDQALAAFDRALNIDREYAYAWMNRGRVLADHLDRPVEGFRAFRRVLYLADRASTVQQRTMALQDVPEILRRLKKAASSPLLVVSTAERHGLAAFLLRESNFLADAYRHSRPYHVLQEYARQQSGDIDARQMRSLLGLTAFSLGDPFEAQRHLDALDEIDDTDLRGQFYLARTYREYADETMFEAVVEYARDAARDVLAACRKGEEVSPEQLYYAGQLFVAGEKPHPLFAQRCFDEAAVLGFLPALYMRALVTKNVDGASSGAYRNAVKAVLEAERERHQQPGGEPGFIGGGERNLTQEISDPSTASVQELVENIERAVRREAYASEITDAILDVYDWVEAQGYEDGELLDRHRFVDRGDVWAEQAETLKGLATRLDERRLSEDMEDLHSQVDGHTSQAYSSGSHEPMDLEKQEMRLARRIARDQTGEDTDSNFDLIVYHTLKGRIEARAALTLLAYLNVLSDMPQQRVSTATVERGASGAITVGTAAILELTKTGLSLVASLFNAGMTGIVAALIAEFVKSLREKEIPEYPEFRIWFENYVKGQHDDVYEHVQSLLAEIKARQTMGAEAEGTTEDADLDPRATHGPS